MSPLTIHSDSTALLPPRYCGSIAYYAVMAAYGHAVINTSARFNKRDKDTHRCTIADTRGPLTLTVPVNKPKSATIATWNDITVSTHDQWWNIHLTSLESAYGRTPFFEFYIDRFRPFYEASIYESEHSPLMGLDSGIDAVIRRILNISTTVDYTGTLPADTANTQDYRRHKFGEFMTATKYYQVRADKLGFIAGLSILDLIFNMGPEAPLILKKIQQELFL